MTQKNMGSINFKAIRFEVDDLELAISFYRKLGCIIEEVRNSCYTISVYLSFSRNSDVLIHLIKDFRREKKLDAVEKLPTFEINANEKDEHFYEDVFSELMDYGIEYSNVKKRDAVICAVGQFADTNGFNWELIDDFDYAIE
jgi:hypothetical protein